MRILLLNQFFCPDSAATSQLLTDVARELVEQGHSVEVICGGSTYLEAGSAEAPGVEVRRMPNAGFGRGKVQRLASYFSYLLPAIWWGMRGKKPDLIVSMTTPPGLSVAGGLVAWVKGARHFIWEMDVYTDLVVELRYLEQGAWITAVMGWVFELSRKRADGIITLGECMAERMRGRVADEKIHVAENWADGGLIRPRAFRVDGRLKLLYSGNLGLVHDVDTVREAMRRLREDERVRFTFAGGGRYRRGLEDFCKEHGLEVGFETYAEREELARRLADSDVGLVTQRRETLGCVVPSKTYGIMAAGRGVLFVGPGEATTARMIRKYGCGWHVECGDSDGLVELLRRLAERPELVRDAGRKAREAFVANYDIAQGVGRVCDALGCSGVERVVSATG